MSEINLSIITPSGKIFDQSIGSLSAPGKMGSFGVLPNHAPYISLLDRGVLELKVSGSSKFFAVNTGVFEIDQNNKAVLLTDNAVESSSKEDALQKCSEFTID